MKRILRWLAGPMPMLPMTFSVSLHPTGATKVETKVHDETVWLVIGGYDEPNLSIFTSAYNYPKHHECEGTLAFLRSLRLEVEKAETAVCKVHADHQAGAA
jgi:hypothetical protein